MGWDRVRLEITGQVSRHNSDQDLKDDAAWEEFANRVRAIASEHRYADLDLEVYGAGGP